MPINKILGEELEEDTNKYITEKIKGLVNKAKKSGMPYSILKKVYDRGMAHGKVVIDQVQLNSNGHLQE